MGLNVNGYPLLKVFLMIVGCQIYGIAKAYILKSEYYLLLNKD